MKTNYILILIFFFGIQTISFGQDSILNKIVNNSDYPEEIELNDQNHFITAQYKYMSNQLGQTFSSQGGMANIGINFARFFSKKIIIGPCLDLKLMPGFSKTNLSDSFVSQFNTNFLTTYNNSIDSINADLVHRAINSKSNTIKGFINFNYGLMFSLFPQKYGGILFELKYGYTGYFLRNGFGSTNVNVGAYDKVPLTMRHWIYEITFKPFAFFQNTYVSTKADEYRFGNSIVFSFFYERLNLRTAEFDVTKLASIVSESFFTKYGVDHRFGFKIGMAFY